MCLLLFLAATRTLRNLDAVFLRTSTDVLRPAKKFYNQIDRSAVTLTDKLLDCLTNPV